MSGKMHKRNRRWVVLLGTTLAAGWSTVSLAGISQIPLQNVTNLGTAYAGAASLAEDASTGFWNSAGLTHIKSKEQIVAGGILSAPSTMLHVTSATSNTGTPLNPGSARPSNRALVPSMHYAKKINDRWAFGLSAVTTFGSKTNYKPDSVARYIATRSEMMAINAGPSIAYRFDQGFSLGGGVDALYVATQMASNIASAPGVADGFQKSIVSRTGLGYHVGILQALSEATRFGAQYRSKIHVTAKGDSTVQGTPTATATNQRTWGNLDFPEYVILSAYHDVNAQWAVVSDLQLTHWSKLKNMVLRYEDNTALMIAQNYKNNYRLAVGGIYQYDQKWRFKMGGSFEKRGTHTIGRSIFIPDQDQIVPAVGVQYRLSKRMALDVAYAHIFYKKQSIDQSAPIGTPSSTANIKGDMRHQIKCMGAQLTWDL
ncbi:MAG: transporter [Gammaproteobacteria bacterium]|nr:transporter [Gammaproteobacteria bacterium]MBP9728787.1 transporter [Gammaproteobacteria bacterium]